VKHSKRYKSLLKYRDRPYYPLTEAIELVKKTATAKFDESVDLAVRLGVDPKKQNQMVRGSANLPFGTGKRVRVLVITKGEKEKEAKEAGADYVGGEEYLEKIKNGWLEFDYIVATPDMMPQLGRLGKILGPKGLMPSPKTNTVTFDIGDAVRSLKKGRINFKTDRTGNVHTIVGKVSFETEKLRKNILALLSEILRLKPSGLKGQYLKSVTLSSSMGPGFSLDMKELLDCLRRGE